ncbi:hypothetical protein BS78_05G053100 [Paspalum vaginatum]|nr:hypothetical protein BS78_05G053100 [Paspalum vaginatum]
MHTGSGGGQPSRAATASRSTFGEAPESTSATGRGPARGPSASSSCPYVAGRVPVSQPGGSVRHGDAVLVLGLGLRLAPRQSWSPCSTWWWERCVRLWWSTTANSSSPTAWSVIVRGCQAEVRY